MRMPPMSCATGPRSTDGFAHLPKRCLLYPRIRYLPVLRYTVSPYSPVFPYAVYRIPAYETESKNHTLLRHALLVIIRQRTCNGWVAQ